MKFKFKGCVSRRYLQDVRAFQKGLPSRRFRQLLPLQ
jgi:hypothetical protein